MPRTDSVVEATYGLRSGAIFFPDESSRSCALASIALGCKLRTQMTLSRPFAVKRGAHWFSTEQQLSRRKRVLTVYPTNVRMMELPPPEHKLDLRVLLGQFGEASLSKVAHARR